MIDYKVLDLTDERGQLCGQILAMLGCDVALVEPPGGSTSRHLGPWAGEEPGPERSLWHWSYNRGKRSVVCDLATDAGRAALLELVRRADVLLETYEPGTLDALGLGPDVLAAANPRLVHLSLTAFGSDGPKAGWAASDLTLTAASGYAALTGDEDRAPLRISLPQSFHHAATEGAGGVLAALRERDQLSGRGQHLDMSAQHSLSVCTQSYMLAQPTNSGSARREAGGVRVSGLDAKIQLLWPCKDGQVSTTFLFGAAMGPFSRRLMEWVHEEGFCDDATLNKDWIEYGTMLFDGREPVAEYERVKQVVHDFFATKTKAELFEATFSRRLLIAPVNTVADLASSEHFAAREFWHDVDVPAAGRTVRYPGAFAKFSAAPLPNLAAAAPLGADDPATVAAAWAASASSSSAASGGTAPQVQVREGSRPAPDLEPARTGRPLEGLKVADFMWVFAGPYCSRMLSDMGATVVRIESATHIDTLRTAGSFQDNITHPDRALQFTNVNAGKLGVALDLSKPEARDVAIDLVKWADLTTESFTPKAMRNWGLDYESLRVHKPDLIMSSSCLMGHYGPNASLAGYGTMAAAVSGWFHITGWPDRLPCGPFSAYTDYVSPRFLLCSLLAAVEHRRRTGEGQYIDLSQAEASLQLMAPAVLDYMVNGRIMERAGNDDTRFAPHGIYRAAGDDGWLAVAVTTDDEWRALCGVLGRSDLAGLSEAERRERRPELDEVVGAWVAGRSPEDGMTALQAVRVPSHQAQNYQEVWEDPQLRHRDHFVELPHGEMGMSWVENSRFRFSRTPVGPVTGAPTLGEHSWQVLTEILGYSDDQAGELAAAGVFE